MMEIYEDTNTLYMLKHGRHHPDTSGLHHQKERHWVRNRSKRFVITDGKLYKTVDDGILRYVPPVAGREKVVRDTHEIGHRAAESISRTVFERFWWPGTLDMAKKVVAGCAPCQPTSRELTEPRTKTSIPIFHIFHCRHIDLIGPIPTSARGHKYIINAVAATK